MTEFHKTVTVSSGIGLNGPLQIELLPNGRSARLIKNYKVRIAGSLTITVPAGFETDFASVPRLFWRIVPPWGRYSPAAVVHDFLYHTGLVIRAEADRIFLDLMTKLGVQAWKRQLMYWAVRVGGWKAWNDSRRRKNSHA